MDEKDKKNTEVQTINGYFKKQLIGCRLSTETIELIDENFELITGNTHAVTDRKLVECLVDMALSKVKPNTDGQKRIAELVAAIDDLTIKNDQLEKNLGFAEERIAELSSEYSALEGKQSNSELAVLTFNDTIIAKDNEINRLQAENSSLRASSGAIPENAVLVDLTKLSILFIDEMCAAESVIAQKEISRSMLIKNLLFHVIKYGPFDMFMSKSSVIGEKLRRFKNMTDNIS
ncbi:MAG: hypothetical protein WCP32_10345 [Bacteroidota bacterium]